MNNKKILISISTYKESENIINLINLIRNSNPLETILIVNDFSNDGTKNLVKKLNDKNLVLIERPFKLGLGTAHKLAIFYSIKYNYDFLVTMDADFSHDPSQINSLIEKSEVNNFVIGSRFCKGGKLDYTGLRKIISIGGNFFAKKILNININELTTYFRVYSVKLLKKLPYDELNAQGYSLGVKIVWMMKKLNAKLIEVPIHFKDRNKGKSKIPKFQIFVSFFDLIYIKFQDFFIKNKFYSENPTYRFDKKCDNCNYNFFSLKKKLFQCLVCGRVEK